MNEHLVTKVEEREALGVPYLVVETDKAKFIIRGDRYTYRSYTGWKSLVPMEDTLFDVQPENGTDFYSDVIATFGARLHNPVDVDDEPEYVEPSFPYTGKVESDGYVVMPDGHRGISTMTRILVQHPNVFECKDFYAFVKRVVDAKPSIPVHNVYQFWGEYWMKVGLFEHR